MYLSKLVLDPRYTYSYSIVNNPALLHSFVQTRPFGTARKERNVLFRLVKDNDRYILYVQSETMPDWEPALGQGIRLEAVRNTDKMKDLFKEGSAFGFSLMANPVVSPVQNENGHARSRAGNGVGPKRVFLETRSERLEWIKKLAAKNGFEIVWAQEKSAIPHRVRKKGNREFVIGTVEFDGVLKITDRALFEKAYREGIGRERAYGCGMLMLHRAA